MKREAVSRLTVEEFDLAATLNSGQVFHWEPLEGGGFVGAIDDAAVSLAQPEPGILEVSARHAERARHYLGLDRGLTTILSSFPRNDEVLRQAIAFCPGLRVLRQPPWECLATFITSSLKQVAHIRQISLRVRKRFGNPLFCMAREVYAYPSPETLASAGEGALRECGMGYRAKALDLAARRLASGDASLAAMERLSSEELRSELCAFYGVGEKIANCVILFGFGRLDAFPVDVWMERLLRKHYGASLGAAAPLARVQEFAEDHFGPYGGYAQQYLFHYARCGGEKK